MSEIEFISEPTVRTISVSRPVEDAGFDNIDLLPVNAARVSASGFSTEYSKRDAGLERRLIADLHGTPFEHAVMTFFIEVPLFVNAQWHTHRWSSFNQESARYSEMKPRFYVPNMDDWRKQSGKAMDYQFDNFPGDDGAVLTTDMTLMCKMAWEGYEEFLRMGVAREQARMILPHNTMTRFWWTVNLRSLANFLSLRTDEHAQKEIRDAAFLVEEEVKKYFPEFHKAWAESGRKAIGA